MTTAVRRANAVIGVSLAALAAWEAYAILNKDRGDTISEVTREAFRVRTRPGAMVFLVVLGSVTSWFAAHIVQRDV